MPQRFAKFFAEEREDFIFLLARINPSTQYCHFDVRRNLREKLDKEWIIVAELLVEISPSSKLTNYPIKLSFENGIHSPDSSGNPFAFFFKKQKIGTDSGISS
jgi:hypothetical protein